MDVIILAGGRGIRMGDLTLTKQKGTLPSHGKPILRHIVDSLLPLPGIDTIYIATGYRADDVQMLVRFNYSHYLARKKIRIIDIHGVSGTQSRLSKALKNAPCIRECLVTGVDIIVPPHLFLQTIHEVSHMKEKRILLCASSRLEVAPTHWLNRVDGDNLLQLAPCDHEPTHGTWLREMGLRYFPPHIVDLLRKKKLPDNTYFMPLMKEVLVNEPILVQTYDEEWHHFAEQKDLT